MRLSDLQKFILKNIWRARPQHCSRRDFDFFYQNKKQPPDEELRVKIITKSLERLIDKGLIVAYGHKTQERFFIEEVKLTPQGRQLVKKLIDQQLKLPLKTKKK